MKVTLVGYGQVTARQTPEVGGLAVHEFASGEEVALRKLVQKNGSGWVEVGLSEKGRGYISGETLVFPSDPVAIRQDGVKIYSQPSEQSEVVSSCQKGAKVRLIGCTYEGQSVSRVKLRDALGHEGFVDPKVMVKAAGMGWVGVFGAAIMVLGGWMLLGELVAQHRAGVSGTMEHSSNAMAGFGGIAIGWFCFSTAAAKPTTLANYFKPVKAALLMKQMGKG